MYDLLEINAFEKDIDELEHHLTMNNYTFDRLGYKFYVLEDETDYVVTICKDWGLDVYVNDEEV